MKNLNKKTGTVALAGMLVAGGIAVSGISAYADSSFNLSQKNDIQRVEFFCERNSATNLKVTKNEQEIKDAFKGYDRSKKYNNGHVVKVGSASEIARHISDAKRSKREVLAVKLHDLYYLIKVS